VLHAECRKRGRPFKGHRANDRDKIGRGTGGPALATPLARPRRHCGQKTVAVSLQHARGVR